MRTARFFLCLVLATLLLATACQEVVPATPEPQPTATRLPALEATPPDATQAVPSATLVPTATPTAEPYNPCPAWDPAWTGPARIEHLTIAGQLGGIISGLASYGDFVYAAVGPRLLIFDARDLAQPALVGQSPVFASFVSGVSIDGPYAYVTIGNNGLCVFDLADPVRPRALAALHTTGSITHALAQNRRLYYYDSSRSPAVVRIFDVADPADPVELGTLALPEYAGVSGMTLAGDATPRLYLAGSQRTLYVVDVANPATPTLLGQLAATDYRLPRPESSDQRGIAAAGHYVYLLLGGAGLSIVDVSDLAHPTEVARLPLEHWPRDLALAGDRLLSTYSNGVRDSGVYVVNVADPLHPVLSDILTTRGAPDVIALSSKAGTPQAAFVAGRGDGLQVLDLRNPAQPRLAGVWAWPNLPMFVACARGYAYIVSPLGLYTIDVRDSARLEVTSYLPDVGGALVISGTTLYVGDTGVLRIFDLADPARPALRGATGPSTPPRYSGSIGMQLVVAGHYAYLDQQVIDVSDPAQPRPVGSLPFGRALAVSGTHAYVAGAPGIQIVNLKDPVHPQIVGTYALAGGVDSMAAEGGYLYVSVGDRLRVLDLHDEEHPVERGQTATLGWRIRAVGPYVYQVTGAILLIADASDPDQPVAVARYIHIAMFSALDVAIDGELIYVAGGLGGLHVLRFDPRVAGPLPTATVTPTVGYAPPRASIPPVVITVIP